MSDQLDLFEDMGGQGWIDRRSYAELAEAFCTSTPYRLSPLNKRNWGGSLHSLCSYQGKLKPSIAHVLVAWFTQPGDTVYDPMSGVGTIPLEARRQGRIALGNDLSPLAYAVTSAKIEPIDREKLGDERAKFARAIAADARLDDLTAEVDVDWGLNRPLVEYFHSETLREVLLARRYLLSEDAADTAECNLIRSSVMHVLHGNRPYALSRRSHPVTPFAPTGAFEYRSLLDRLDRRLGGVVPELLQLRDSSPDGHATLGDFRRAQSGQIDSVITSPPFSKSLRFWSSNWMRLWFSGWDPDDFKVQPERYLETEQKISYEPYGEFARQLAPSMKAGSRLILHLGETSSERMSDEISPLLAPYFDVRYIGREDVGDTESHGLTDKGATVAHWYLFAERSTTAIH